MILRGTGYDPVVVPYDAVFALIKRLDDLIDKDISPEVNEEAIMEEMTNNPKTLKLVS